MKRIIIGAILLVGVFVAAQPILEPIEPKPVEVKPVLVSVEKPWNGSFYQVVKLPDGSRQRLKSRTALTLKQWEAKADKVWEDQKAEPQPVTCSECGQEYYP